MSLLLYHESSALTWSRSWIHLLFLSEDEVEDQADHSKGDPQAGQDGVDYEQAHSYIHKPLVLWHTN